METALDKAWMPKLVQYMNGDWDGNGTVDLAKGDQGVSWTYWAWSPGSGDTGGILNDSWQVDATKYNAIKAGLYTGTAGGTTTTTADALFTIKLSAAATQAVTVDYSTVDGTAKAGSDYTAASGKLTFAAGETAKTVAVKVLSDSITEGTETFSLKLSNPTQSTISDATGIGTITEAAAKLAAAAVSTSAATAATAATLAVPSADIAAVNVWTNAVTAPADSAAAQAAAYSAVHSTASDATPVTAMDWYDPAAHHDTLAHAA